MKKSSAQPAPCAPGSHGPPAYCDSLHFASSWRTLQLTLGQYHFGHCAPFSTPSRVFYCGKKVTCVNVASAGHCYARDISLIMRVCIVVQCQKLLSIFADTRCVGVLFDLHIFVQHLAFFQMMMCMLVNGHTYQEWNNINSLTIYR